MTEAKASKSDVSMDRACSNFAPLYDFRMRGQNYNNRQCNSALTGLELLGYELTLAVLRGNVAGDGTRLEEDKSIVVDIGHLAEGLLFQVRG
jgi:hypothetical protein